MLISVLVCTRNRAEALTPCLDSILTALKTTEVSSELVVVDNGSTDHTADIMTKYAASTPLPLHFVREPRPGLSRARNAGMRVAQGEWLAFTDDDCRPAADYYQNLLSMVGRNPEPALIGGRVELADVTDQPYCILTRSEAEFWQRGNPAGSTRPLAEALIGANMVLHRQLLAKVGEFDERFGAGGLFRGGEEIDYLYRTWLAGLPVRYAPELVIHHAHGRKTLADVHKLARGYDRGDGSLYAKYLWRAPVLLKPLWWDFKKGLAELRGGPKCRPELGISHWQRLWGVSLGMADYCRFSRLKT